MPKKGCGAKLSEENRAKYGEAFDAIDEDGKGTLNKSELSVILSQFGISEDACNEAFVKFDTDADGEMDKEEFFDFAYVSNLEGARLLMQAADESGDGKVTPDELAATLEQLGFPADEIASLIENADADGSGVLSVDEMVNALMETWMNLLHVRETSCQI